MNIIQRIALVFVVFVFVYIFSVFGFMLIEDWNFLDAFFMTAITLSTVGYEQPHPLSETGQYFTAAIIFLGMISVAFTVSQITAFIVEGHLQNLLKDRKMNNRIKKLKSHYILCGIGHIGTCVFEEFINAKKSFIVIENNPEKIETLEQKHPDFLYINGSAEEDEILKKAKIEEAEGLITTISSDASNIFIVFTARGLNPNLNIISLAKEQNSIEKLKRSGANHVISPKMIGGLRIASMALRPNVISFLDIMVKEGDQTLRLEEVTIPDDSFLIGKFLIDAEISQRTDVLIMGLKHKEDSKIIMNPSSMTLLDQGTVLIVYGNERQILELNKLINRKNPPPGFSGLLEMAKPHHT